MAAIAAIVFIALYFVEAGYGMLFDKKWGLPIPNKIAWICMEAPVFIVMFLLWNGSERQFEIVGTILFFTGMAINIQSDHIVRHLRKPGDTNHYLPKKGLFKYVTSANYFGEIVEWCGFAILTWSASGAVFAWWTFANLVPRANTIYHKYKAMFGNELENRKRVIPFIY